MATTAQTRVIPEDLSRSYQRLHAAWQSLTLGDAHPTGTPHSE